MKASNFQPLLSLCLVSKAARTCSSMPSAVGRAKQQTAMLLRTLLPLKPGTHKCRSLFLSSAPTRLDLGPMLLCLCCVDRSEADLADRGPHFVAFAHRALSGAAPGGCGPSSEAEGDVSPVRERRSQHSTEIGMRRWILSFCTEHRAHFSCLSRMCFASLASWSNSGGAR